MVKRLMAKAQPRQSAHRLDSIPQLRSVQDRLQGLGITTLEQLVGAAQAARPELEAYLQVQIDPLLQMLPVAAAAIPQQALSTIQKASYALGVALDRIPRATIAPPLLATTAAPPPPSINLVPQMPPIRNQGSRGTCVAFASLGAYEHFLGKAGAHQDLSEQFLYWDCKSNDGHPTEEGTWVGVAFPLLKRDGCCLEGTWPYNPVPIPGNESQGPPPGGAKLQALTFRLANFQVLAPTSVADIKTALADSRCVAFSIPVFNSWYGSPQVAYSGDITLPIPGEVRNGGHAMCLVGYADSAADVAIGGGRFIVRNSWDTTWGLACPYGAGYGTIPYAYITRFASEAYAPI